MKSDEEGKLSPWARKQLSKSRNNPISSFTSLDEFEIGEKAESKDIMHASETVLKKDWHNKRDKRWDDQ